MKRIFCLLLILAAGLVFARDVHPANNTYIRVAVIRDRDKVTLAVKGPYRLEAIHTDLLLDRGERLREEPITPTDAGLKIGERDFKIHGLRVIPERDSTIYIDGKRYRGLVDIIRMKNLKLLVVNHIELESYLYGVLFHEVPHYWPYEVLKAQAVAARTFALYRIRSCKDKDYDVTSDVYSQVYGGRGSERWKTTRAVKATRGQVLTYRGEILPAYYHSMCAGHTEDANVVFGIDLPPLKGVKCPYCKGARRMSWKASFSYKQIAERLNKYGIKASGIKHIAEGERDASGRLLDIKIKDKDGEKSIEAYKFRLALGPNMIKSTNFTIKITRGGIIFSGKGWGHGVGMCQWGAFGMGRRRASYKKILDFYYPGAKIEKVK